MGIYASKEQISLEEKKALEKKKLQINYEKFQRKGSMLAKHPKGYAINQCKTLDENQKFKNNRPNTFDFSNVGVPRFSNKGISKEEDKNEYFDSLEILQLKIKQVVQLLRESKYAVVYSGAGISTSADLPDFRGPNGAWTKEEAGISGGFSNAEETKIPSLTEIVPTYAHMAIAKLMELGMVKAVVTTNMDNLHMRSGVPADKLVELHGNSFKERCTVCGKEYYRKEEIYEGMTLKCEVDQCTGTLVDTIVNFNEPIYQRDWDTAKEHSEKSDLSIVIGTSMRVLPSCLLPEMSIIKNGPENNHMVICNFQITPYDDSSTPRVFSPSDDFFYYLMQELQIETPTLTPKGENIKSLSFPTQPKSHHVDSQKLDPSVYNVNFRFLF
ncbi:NAD(+)-dependent deacetylase [Tieghemostelium lacteum]|uniref:Regulatory protein SIR2 homolog 7 n=1 Tax=Tieghemostelium lacteum TaxID=361077 RepID=A0A151ZDM8_TIELA|nr:NAD(+)-dependent deacetylase [Tieghemostelium lacteum]|eukprot:KYQ92035.1 NAD(+)-dependent deacetylase [Tieghemostelium lacteum]